MNGNTNTIFTVEPETLQSLRSREAVHVMRSLLWAEAYRFGVASDHVTISLDVDVNAGGIDAAITAPAPESSLISCVTRFQIKSGASFKPWDYSAIKSELFGRKSISIDTLKPAIRRSIEAHSRYVVVTFWHDLQDEQRTSAQSHLAGLFEECGLSGVSVDIWGTGQLLGFLSFYPSICLGLNGRSGLHFQTLRSWRENLDMSTPYSPGSAQTACQHDIRSQLASGVPHVRISGEPGLGKTRLALESLDTDELSSLVLYVEHAERFRNSELLSSVLRVDNCYRAILVIDDCSDRDLQIIWNLLARRSGRIKLVSVMHDPARRDTGEVCAITMPPLPEEQIKQILQEHGVSGFEVDRWSRLCEGSPRVAHAIGENLSMGLGENPLPPTRDALWSRFIQGAGDGRSEADRRRWLVLRYLALFHKFGYESPVDDEGTAILSLIQEAEPTITNACFSEIVAEFRLRRILQGASTLRIVPKALHVWLWLQWWDNYGNSFQLDLFLSLPGQLPEWIGKMFEYGASAPRAQSRVRELFESDQFTDDTISEETSARFVEALSLAHPEAGIDFYERTLGRWTDDRVLSFVSGRRPALRALERIVVWEALFVRGARLMSRLAECENESYSNNSSGLFRTLFQPEHGPTEAPPNVRMGVLRSGLVSDLPARRQLVIEACESALTRESGIRAIGAEHQGLRTAVFWRGRTWGDVFEAYRDLWRLLAAAWERFEGEEQSRAANALISSAVRHLHSESFLYQEVTTTLKRLAVRDAPWRRELIAKLQRVSTEERGRLHDKSAREFAAELRDEVVGTSLEDRMHRHVGMNLQEDRPLATRYEEAEQEIQRTMQALALECVEDRDTLNRLLPWLLTKSAERAMMFSMELAPKLPTEHSVLNHAQRLQAEAWPDPEQSLLFISGFLRVMRETDAEAWELVLDDFAEHPIRRQWFVELTWRSGALTDRAVQRLIGSIQRGALGVVCLGYWRWGREVEAISVQSFHSWIQLLLDSTDEQAHRTAITLFSSYYCRIDDAPGIPVSLTLRLLLATVSTRRGGSDATAYNWELIVKRYVTEESVDVPSFVRECIVGAFQGGSVYRSLSGQIAAALRGLFKASPGLCWLAMHGELADPEFACFVLSWLRADSDRLFASNEHDGCSIVPQQVLLNWIDEDVESRARLVARYGPQTLSGEAGELTREILRRYGQIARIYHQIERSKTAQMSSALGTQGVQDVQSADN